MADKALPCPTVLRLLIRYDPETGKLFWQSRARGWFPSEKSFLWWNKVFAEKEALTALSGGYFVGTVLGKSALAHRVAYSIHYGIVPDFVDHQNGDRSDNRVQNLKSVPRGQNNKNVVLSEKNTSGVCGVYWDKKYRKWYSQIRANGKKISIGRFDNFAAAAAARKSAEQEYGYHPNHGLPKDKRA